MRSSSLPPPHLSPLPPASPHSATTIPVLNEEHTRSFRETASPPSTRHLICTPRPLHPTNLLLGPPQYDAGSAHVC